MTHIGYGATSQSNLRVTVLLMLLKCPGKVLPGRQKWALLLNIWTVIKYLISGFFRHKPAEKKIKIGTKKNVAVFFLFDPDTVETTGHTVEINGISLERKLK